MVNYYKILGIENYASIEDVKLAYKQKVRQYHPDLNSDSDAIEITQWLNLAKDVLTNIESKQAYDLKLKLAYIIEIHRLKEKQSSWGILQRQELKKKREEKEKLKEKELYDASIKRFPFYIRVLGLAATSLWGLQLIYSNYFALYPGFERLISILGFFIFCASLVVLSNQIYTYFRVKSVDHVIQFNYEKWIARFLVLTLISGPLGIYALNEYRENYYLTHQFEYYLADINAEATKKGVLVYEYEVDGVKYLKRKPKVDGTPIILKNGKLLIKYATSDPKIASPVFEEF